jgi:hypothetical protein
MTVKSRNLVYWTLFIWILFSGFFVSFMVAGALVPDIIPARQIISPVIASPEAGIPSGSQLLESLLSRPDAANIFRVILVAGSSLAVAGVFAGLFIRFFRRITASHLLFLYLFLFSLSGELLKGFNFMLNYFGANEGLLLMISRISLGMYLIGVLSGFTISLYLLGIKYQHQGTTMLILFFLSGFIAIGLPMNTSGLNANYLYETYYYRELLWSVGGLLIVAGLGYISHLWERFSRQELARVLFALMFLVGHALLHFSLTALGGIVGGGMIITGLTFYFLRLFYDYFWY